MDRYRAVSSQHLNDDGCCKGRTALGPRFTPARKLPFNRFHPARERRLLKINNHISNVGHDEAFFPEKDANKPRAISNLQRRTIVSAALAILPTVSLAWPRPAAAKDFSIQESIDTAKPGDIIKIPGGTYYEKLFINKAIVLEPASETDTVTVVWETTDHYEPVLSCENARGAIVRRLVMKHTSPSIANNYAVFLQEGQVSLEGCDITSSSGSGVAAEGGDHTVRNCSVHGCQRHGIAVFGTLEGDECKVLIQDTVSEGNRQNGVLVRDQGSAYIENCTVRDNDEYGVSVSYAECVVSKSTSIQNNRKGDLFKGPGSDFVLGE